MSYPNPAQSVVISVSKRVFAGTNEKLRRFCLVSSGDTGLQEGEIKGVNSENWEATITSDNGGSKKFAKSFFLTAKNKTLYVLEVGGGGTAEERLQKVEKFIDAGVDTCYMYSLPPVLLADAYLGTLLTKYSSVESAVYFEGRLDNTPTQSAWFETQAKGKKAFFGTFDNSVDKNYLMSGAFMGVMASGKFDISTGNRMSPLDKTNAVLVPSQLETATQSELADAPVSWGAVSSTGRNVIVGTRFADGETFDYYYSLDNIMSELELGIESLLESGANGGSPVTYNEIGAKMLQNKAITILKALQAKGFVDRFAEGYDEAREEIKGLDSVAYIPVDKYKADNPQDVKNSIYGGLSCWIEVQRYIMQVKFSVSIQ